MPADNAEEAIASVSSLHEQILNPAQDIPNIFQRGIQIFTERVVTFSEDQIPITEVPWEKNHVNSQAREYADPGKKSNVQNYGYIQNYN